MKITLVEFYWVDSERRDGWDMNKDFVANENMELCFTSAILVKSCRHYLYVTSSLSNHEHLSLLSIPKKAIVGPVKKRTKTITLEV